MCARRCVEVKIYVARQADLGPWLKKHWLVRWRRDLVNERPISAFQICYPEFLPVVVYLCVFSADCFVREFDINISSSYDYGRAS